jgi:hypothetical protein
LLAIATAALGGCTGNAAPNIPSAGGTPSPSTAADPLAQELAFVECMRQAGITDMPDPVPGDESGRSAVRYAIDVMGKGSDAVFQTALDGCLIHLPAPPPDEPPSADEIEAMQQFSQCMRDHGIAEYPDVEPAPGSSDGVNWVVGIPGPVGVPGSPSDKGVVYLDIDNPQVRAAWEACQDLLSTNGEQ